MSQLSRPLLLFDGDCAFCRRWVDRLAAMSVEPVDMLPFQEGAHLCPEIPREQFERGVVRVEPDGELSVGAKAIFRSAAGIPGERHWLWCYEHLPGFARASEAVYGFIARRRGAFLVLDTLLFGRAKVLGRTVVTSWVFLRLLGLVYFLAFLSIGSQIEGLVGSNGVLPAGEYLSAAERQLEAAGEGAWAKIVRLPTIFWWSTSDAFLGGACTAGCIAALLVVFDLVTLPMLALLWVLYLSVTIAGQSFLEFQWDGLLLESGFLSLFLAPLHLLPTRRGRPPPSRAAVWVLRWLVFRLLFSSGIVKLLSGDEHWKQLTALEFHYETQPVPSWVSWWVHQLPAWFQSASAGGMFFVELVLPFLVFLPRMPRAAACLGILGLQALIAVTGNYGFFNLLTAALALLLLDDGFFPSRLREWLGFAVPARSLGGRARAAVGSSACLALFLLSLVPFSWALHKSGTALGPIHRAYSATHGFHLVGYYGLFARMTTTRPELIFEGSDDGNEFLPIEFRYKPGRLDRPPPMLGPHMPRLDWQLWFAALHVEGRRIPPDTAALLTGLSRHLLQGTPVVWALLEPGPFRDRPPRHLRVRLVQYRFTDRETRAATGNWWRTESDETVWVDRR